MRAVPVGEIKEHWQRIKYAVQDLTKYGTDGWIAEDVYAFLIGGHAVLYVADGVDGFAILQLLPNYTEKRLHIWIVSLKDDPALFIEEIVDLGKQQGVKRITFESPRKGWGKRAGRLGFKAMRTVYERKL